MNLYLFRHGSAAPAGFGEPDAGRALTREGKAEVKAMARWLDARNPAIDLIAASPYVRAQETAAITVKFLGQGIRRETWDALVPSGEPEDVIRRIESAHAEALLIVGHEPLLSTVAGILIAGAGGARVAMTKAGLAKIRDLSFSSGCSGELHWLVTPRVITRAK